MQLDPHHIHIWSIDLSITPVQEKNLLALLSADEKERVHRIRLSTHKQRSIAARGYLRRILALYLNIAPEMINFAYTEHHKPFLAQDFASDLQFNLAHSHDQALVALSMKHPIGVDIEKIGAGYNPQVAARYFSRAENAALERQPNEQNLAFYQIWSRKEAIVKAIGLGLSLTFSSFSVAANDSAETISLQGQDWSLTSLTIVPDFAAAVATAQTIKAISYWRLTADGYTMIR